MKCSEYLTLDLCQELVFLTINLYRAFTTHPVVCIKTFGPGGTIYYTYTALIYSMHTLYNNVIGFILFLYKLFLRDVDIIDTFILLIVFTLCFF